MIVTYIRSSSYGNYDYCQMQYFLTYVLGHRSPSGKRAQLGTIVHKVMECLSACTKELQDNPSVKDLEIYDDAIGNIQFTKRKLKTKKFVNELLDESYSYYTRNCGHSYHGADLKFCKEMVEVGLSYNDGQFDPRKRNILASEPKFDIPIDEEWAKFDYEWDGKRIKGQLAIKGTVDLITKVDDKTIEVIDWKTGQRKNWATGEKKTYEKLLEDPQLLLYNYAISQIYPNYDQAIMSIFFLRDGGPFSMCFDQHDQSRFLDMLRSRFEEIQRNHKPQPIDPNRKDFRCQKLCHFYKTKWPGTNQTMCHYVEDQLVQIGYNKTVAECKRKNFDIGYYEAPG